MCRNHIHSCPPRVLPLKVHTTLFQGETLAGLLVTDQREPARLGQGASLTRPQLAELQDGGVNNSSLENCSEGGTYSTITTTITTTAVVPVH